MNENFILKQTQAGKVVVEVRVYVYDNTGTQLKEPESPTVFTVRVYDNVDRVLLVEDFRDWKWAIRAFRRYVEIALAATGASWLITDEERSEDKQ